MADPVRSEHEGNWTPRDLCDPCKARYAEVEDRPKPPRLGITLAVNGNQRAEDIVAHRRAEHEKWVRQRRGYLDQIIRDCCERDTHVGSRP